MTTNLATTPTAARHALRLAPGAAAAVRDAARAAGRQECCGALVGTLQADGAVAREAWPLVNVAERPVAEYAIEPAGLVRTQREARSRGLDVVGYYHSHPSGDATPSSRDIDAAVPGYVYLIAGRDGLRAWRAADHGGPLEELQLVEETS